MGPDPTQGGLILNLNSFSGEGARMGGSSEVRSFDFFFLIVKMVKERHELFISPLGLLSGRSFFSQSRHHRSRSTRYLRRRECVVFFAHLTA